MRKLSVYMILFLFLIAGCSNHDLSKKQYYERGLSFIEGGNPNGAIIAFKKAVESDQSYFEARYQLALAYMLQNKYESAEKELNKVLRLNPYFDEARLSLSRTFINSGKIDEAIGEINLYLKNNDGNPEAYELAARAYLAKNDFGEAETALKQALSISPARTSSRLALAGLYITSGQTGMAEKIVGEVLESDESNTEALHLRAGIEEGHREFGDMIRTYERIVDIDPEDIKARFELGLTYLRVNNIEKAKEVSDSFLASHKGRPESVYLSGLVHYYEGNTDDAIEAFKAALKYAPIPGAHFYLGAAYMSKRDFEQAATEFQKVIEVRPDMEQARLMIAVAHLKKGRAEQAEREIRKVLESNNQNAVAHNLLGSVYLALGRGDAAMQEFDRAIEINPGLVDAYIKKGASSLMSGNSGMAEKEFISAVEIAPDLLGSRIILARYYIKSKRYADAVNILKEGLKENPDDAVLYNIIGAAYLGMGDMEQARKSFGKAISANSGFLLPYFNLARLYVRQNETENAVRECEKVLSIDRDNVPALLMLARIRESEHNDSEALSYYERARALENPAAYTALAEYYLRKNESALAMGVLDEAIEMSPDNVSALDMKGMILIAGKDFQGALAVYEKLKVLRPDVGLERVADIYTVMGEYKSAIMNLEEILFKHPGHTGVLAKLVDLYIKENDFAEAEKRAENIIDSRPESDTGYRSLAAVYYADRQYRKALEAINKAKKINPDDLNISVLEGRIYIALKDLRRAMQIFNEIENAHPEYTPVFYYQASVLEMMGKNNDAVLKHRKTLEHLPNHVPTLNNLAYLYSEGLGSLGDALAYARKAKELSERDGSVTDTLGWILYKMGNYDEAVHNLIEATHYSPAQPTIRYHLGLAYLRTGDEEKAEEQLKNAVRLGRQSSFPDVKEAENILKELNN